MKRVALLASIAFLAPLPTFAQSPNVQPFVCPVTEVTTGGVAVNAVTVPVNGGVLVNFPDASQNLFISQTGTAGTAESATTYPLQPGQPWFIVPHATLPVSVNAVTGSQHFFCIEW